MKVSVTHSELETFHLAEKLGRDFRGNEIVLLTGELGAGKTVFAKGLASGLGVKDISQVCSPSYTLINIYQGKYPLYHLDLYRLREDAEISDLGWEDFLGEAVVIVEWAEKIKFPMDGIRVTIEVGRADERTISIRP
jgi:tRNA threonylcarbamoyladenosine biosynthesis protein TsaE